MYNAKSLCYYCAHWDWAIVGEINGNNVDWEWEDTCNAGKTAGDAVMQCEKFEECSK